MSRFDTSSGQVYTETSAPVRSMIPTWMTQARGRRDSPSEYQSRGNGCSSLQQMALRSCIWHVDHMEPEALEWLGWHYASRIYERLKTTDNLTFNTWSVFQKAFPKQIDRHHQFHVSEREAWSLVPTQLPSMVDRMAKLDPNMLTFLCIRNFSLTIDHLIALAKIHTLAGLVLEHRHSPTDRNMPTLNFNHWGRAVFEKNSFRKLKLLVVGNFGVSVEAVLRGVRSFPTLTLLGVHQSEEIGGRPQKVSGDRCIASPLWIKEKTTPPDELNPRKIWVNPLTTKAQKMQLLYDLCNKIQPEPSTEAAPKSSMSVSYICSEWFTQDDSIVWLRQEPTERTAFPTKRHKSLDLDEGQRDDTNKKRKIREVKKIDVGSLLSTLF